MGGHGAPLNETVVIELHVIRDDILTIIIISLMFMSSEPRREEGTPPENGRLKNGRWAQLSAVSCPGEHSISGAVIAVNRVRSPVLR